MTHGWHALVLAALIGAISTPATQALAQSSAAVDTTAAGTLVVGAVVSTAADDWVRACIAGAEVAPINAARTSACHPWVMARILLQINTT